MNEVLFLAAADVIYLSHDRPAFELQHIFLFYKQFKCPFKRTKGSVYLLRKNKNVEEHSLWMFFFFSLLVIRFRNK